MKNNQVNQSVGSKKHTVLMAATVLAAVIACPTVALADHGCSYHSWMNIDTGATATNSPRSSYVCKTYSNRQYAPAATPAINKVAACTGKDPAQDNWVSTDDGGKMTASGAGLATDNAGAAMATTLHRCLTSHSSSN